MLARARASTFSAWRRGTGRARSARSGPRSHNLLCRSGHPSARRLSWGCAPAARHLVDEGGWSARAQGWAGANELGFLKAAVRRPEVPLVRASYRCGTCVPGPSRPSSSGAEARPLVRPGQDALDQHEAAHVRRYGHGSDVDAVRARFTDQPSDASSTDMTCHLHRRPRVLTAPERCSTRAIPATRLHCAASGLPGKPPLVGYRTSPAGSRPGQRPLPDWSPARVFVQPPPSLAH